MNPSILIIANLIFMKIDTSDTFIKGDDKYMVVYTSGGISTANIYTYKEIITKYPDIKPCKSLFDIKQVWSN